MYVLAACTVVSKTRTNTIKIWTNKEGPDYRIRSQQSDEVRRQAQI